MEKKGGSLIDSTSLVNSSSLVADIDYHKKYLKYKKNYLRLINPIVKLTCR